MPFGPGNNANPRGRPKKGETLTDLIRVELRRKGPDGIPNRFAVVNKLIAMAKAGDMAAMKLLLERSDGKVPQPIDVTSGGEPLAPLTVVVQEVRDRDPGS